MGKRKKSFVSSKVGSLRQKRIGVIGIDRQFPNSSLSNFGKLYADIGMNTGNLMFMEAIFSLIGGDLSQIKFNFDPKFVNKNYDSVVVPAANWLNSYSDWDFLTQKLLELEIPVTVIGLGLQADVYDLEKVQVSDSARRLAQFFSQSSSLISVRGNFTRDWLLSIGIDNVVTTGCPSIYMNNFNQSEVPPGGKIVFQGTRYSISNKFLDTNSINRRMYKFAASFNCPMIYQSEPEEIELLTSHVSAVSLGSDKQNQLMSLYDCSTIKELDNFLSTKGNVFYDLQSWSNFLGRNKAVIGTRLHGSILALNTGRPAILVPHDSRTAEVASFAGIQSLHGPTVRDCQTLQELEALFAIDNVQRYQDIRSKNQATFVQFLKDSNLIPNVERMF